MYTYKNNNVIFPNAIFVVKALPYYVISNISSTLKLSNLS